jgi:hypothetical protein
VDAAVGGANANAEKTRWLILVYQLSREPSRHRIAVWRKLKAIGVLYLLEEAAALPEDAVTREQVAWLRLCIREAGGEATLGQASPDTGAEEKSLVEEFHASREEVYRKLIETAGCLRRKAALGSDGSLLLEELGKLRREFRAERRRDYFHLPLRNETSGALRAVRLALKEGVEPERSWKAGEG